MKHDINSLKKKACSQKLIKINPLKWIKRLTAIKLPLKFCIHLLHPSDFFWVVKRDLANDLEVCPHNFSKTKRRLLSRLNRKSYKGHSSLPVQLPWWQSNFSPGILKTQRYWRGNIKKVKFTAVWLIDWVREIFLV